MKRKISAAVLILTLIMTLFSCRQTPPETATQLSDGDSAHVKEDLDILESKLSEAETATAIKDTDSFSAQLENNDTDIVSYEGNDDIVIDAQNLSGKTITVNTKGSVTLSSPVDSVIIDGAEKGFTVKAKAESIIIEGNSVTAEIESETGTILVKGKDITVNVRNSAVGKLLIVNTTATVNNITDEDIAVTLANGAKITVPSRNTYNVKDNTLQKYKPSK